MTAQQISKWGLGVAVAVGMLGASAYVPSHSEVKAAIQEHAIASEKQLQDELRRRDQRLNEINDRTIRVEDGVNEIRNLIKNQPLMTPARGR